MRLSTWNHGRTNISGLVLINMRMTLWFVEILTQELLTKQLNFLPMLLHRHSSPPRVQATKRLQTVSWKWREFLNENFCYFRYETLAFQLWFEHNKVKRECKTIYKNFPSAGKIYQIQWLPVIRVFLFQVCNCYYGRWWSLFSQWSTGWPKKMCTHENFNCDFD